MAVAELREVDVSSELLMSAVVKQLARGNAAQFTALPEATLEGAIDSLWSRGVTSTRQRNLLTVARELERQLTLVWLSALGDEEIAALAARRGDAQADGEREALVGSYRAEVAGRRYARDPRGAARLAALGGRYSARGRQARRFGAECSYLGVVVRKFPRHCFTFVNTVIH